MESYDREKGGLEEKKRIHLNGKTTLQHWFAFTLA